MTITTTRSSDPMGDRYKFDFKLCTPENGWAQLDSRQDASYYGNWVNPIKLELMSYCEGDTTLIQCDTADEFKTVLRETIDWHNGQDDRGAKIDGMCRPEIIEAFTTLGFAADLH
jgi:hypothetical protein